MPITSRLTTEAETDSGNEIMKDIQPDAEQRARMRKPRAASHQAEPDFTDEGGFVAGVYERWNARGKRNAAEEPRHRRMER